MEECAEVQQAASKALRFGLNDKYTGCDTPADAIARECTDLIAVIEMLESEGVIKTFRLFQPIQEKKAKVEKYMKYAEERGTLTK